MTSVSHSPGIPSQNSSSALPSVAPASAPSAGSGTSSPQASAGRGFANTARKPGSNTGLAASTHARSESVSAAEKSAIPPAVPLLGGPTIVNGSNAVSPTAQHPGEHTRKSSITISASGTVGQMPNGGPPAGQPNAGKEIPQFGQMPGAGAATSPAAPSGAAHPGAAGGSLGINSPPPNNPRVTSPAQSPSPIPHPAASGGRPPSSLQGSSNTIPNFGNFSGGNVDDMSQRQSRANFPPGAMNPNMPNYHLRRESSQSSHNDMSNGAMGPTGNRGAFMQQSGRGRGYQHYGQPAPYSPGPQAFRGAPNAPRGGPNVGQYPGPRAQPLGANYASPHQAARSPSLAHSQPIHGQPGNMPVVSPGMPPTPYGYAPQMGSQQAPGWPGYDPQMAFYPQQMMNQPMQMPQMPQMPMQGYPSPRQPYNTAVTPGAQTPFLAGQYPGQPMSRTSSDVSNRPNSAIGHPPTPMTPAVNQMAANRGSNPSPAPKSSNFKVPAKKSVGIEIRDPNTGQLKTFDKSKPKIESPVPVAASTSPAPPPDASTPPSQTPSSQHVRSDSQSTKTKDEKRNDMKDAVVRRLKEAEEEEKRLKEIKEREEEEAAMAQREEQDAKAKAEVASAVPAVAKDSTSIPPNPPIIKTDDSDEDDSEPEATQTEEDAAVEQETEKPADSTSAKASTSGEPDFDDEEYWKRIEAEEEEREREQERKYQEKKAAEAEVKAKKAAEEAARLDEEMKRQEREAEALEDQKKVEPAKDDDRELFAALKKSDNAFQATQTPPANDTPAESGAATPASDASMGPPPRHATASKQKATLKPEPLKLETTKTVEAPQPSAALQSLRSARFLTAINDKTYPAAIASPNPALNSAAPMGKFRYDKNFLMQFQTVFVEKPSETWMDKVKETVGDTSETPSSARPGRGAGTMVSRTTSNRGSIVPGGHSFGNNSAFGSFSNSRTLPAGSASQARYEASLQNQRPPPAGAIRYNANAPGGFPMGFGQPMSRTASSTSMGHPASPRHNNPSHRGSGRGSKAGKRDTDKEAKTMPLTAGQDLKPIETTSSGWKPRSVGMNVNSGPPPGGDGYLAPDVVQRKVKANLNKMTPTTFDRIAAQILDIVMQSKKETDGRTLRQVIQLTFEKATDEAHFSQMYAEFCSRMLQHMTPEIRDETLDPDKQGNVTSGGTLFRKYLLNRCQQDFEAGWKSKLPDKPEGQTEEAAMMSDEYYAAATAKRRGLGLVKFIGELFKLGMLTSRIMHMCVKRLLDYEGIPDEAEVESLTSLLRTIGERLDSEEKGRPLVDAYFERINSRMNVDGIPSRLKFMLMDIIDLRRKGWKSKEAGKGPATIDEVRAQAAAAEREREVQRAADNSRRAGGGRPGQGRGDARNFSSGPMMPPPQQNTVRMDELRRLGAGSRQSSAAPGPMSFGPSTLGMRGSNPRRPMGAASILGRGEDSSASSRTGTPPIAGRGDRKEKEDKEYARHTNTFSALASLNADEANDHPASPPSAASSPPVAKAQPLVVQSQQQQNRSRSPLGETGSTGA